MPQIPSPADQQLIAAARSLVGTPFRHQGRLPGVGIDCIGVVIVAARMLGWLSPEFDVTGYSREPSNGLLERELDKYLEHDPWGPIVLLKLLVEPQHVGILDWNSATLIHAWQYNNCVVEHGVDSVWLQRVYRSYRWRNSKA